MIDTETPRSPGWWLARLHERIRVRNVGEPLPGSIVPVPGGSTTARHRWLSSGTRPQREMRPGLDLLAAYLGGDAPLPQCTESWADATRQFIRLCRLNMAELVVAPPAERMIPLGWATTEDDRDGDEIAARIAQANDLAGSVLPDTFEAMLGMADGYMLVDPTQTTDGVPLVTAEDPRQAITAEDPATRRTLAGLKVYVDEWTGDEVAHVLLPGEVRVASRSNASGDWAWDEKRSGSLQSDRVTLVRFPNRRGVGEFEPHLDLLDRINDSIFQRIVIAKYQAFRQRAVIGLEAEDEDGNEVDYSETFTADAGALWTLPEGAQFWESGVVDLTGLRMAIKDDLETLAAVTRTPLHYLTPDAANGSAEGASMMREGLVYRVEDRRRRVEARMAQVMSLCFEAMGDSERAKSVIRTLWQPAERFSLSERMSAASQAKAAGLPQEMIWLDVMQYGPQDLPRIEAARAADQLFEPLEAPAAPGQAQQQTANPAGRPAMNGAARPTPEPATA